MKAGNLGLGAAYGSTLAVVESSVQARLTDEALEEAADVESGVAPLRFGRPLILLCDMCECQI